jgi:hypothetical protein
MARLQQSAAALNQISDTAAKTVKEVEGFLETCSIGVPAYVMFADGPSDDDHGYLAYVRVGNRFRIAVSFGEDPDREYVRAWSDCPRDIKLDSFAKLPELLAHIAKRADEKIVAATNAVNEIGKTFASALTKKGANDDIPF